MFNVCSCLRLNLFEPEWSYCVEPKTQNRFASAQQSHRDEGIKNCLFMNLHTKREINNMLLGIVLSFLFMSGWVLENGWVLLFFCLIVFKLGMKRGRKKKQKWPSNWAKSFHQSLQILLVWKGWDMLVGKVPK